MKRILILLLIILFSVGINPINAQADSFSDNKPQDQNRLVVFEAFMNPA
jgi:hypothetical protein